MRVILHHESKNTELTGPCQPLFANLGKNPLLYTIHAITGRCQ